MNRWLKREVAMAGRQRVLVSAILSWGPIFLTAIFVLVIRLLNSVAN
jgi:hypothetical protein